MPDAALTLEIAPALQRLRTAADAAYQGWKPEGVLQLDGAGASRELRVGALRMAEESWFVLPDLALQPDSETVVRIPLRVPERIAGVAVEGEPLGLVVNSMHPYNVAVDGATLIGDAVRPVVAAGPVDTEVLPRITGRDTATLDMRLFTPAMEPAQNYLWFNFTTPRLRARFEVLDLAWARLYLASALAAGDSERSAVRRAAGLVPADLQGDAETLMPQLERVADALEPLAARCESLHVHCIGHSHIDLAYLWTWREAAEVFHRDLPTFVQMMADYPEMHMTHSQPVGYEVVRERDPAMLARIRELVAQGRWEPATAQWVEADATQIAGESMARQFSEGAWWSRQVLGASPQVVLAPDTFGHSGNIPQLAASIGARFYYHHRANPGERVSGEMWPAYWWEGDDGTRILGLSTPHYGGSITAGKIAESARRLAVQHGHQAAMLFFGVSNHGGGPTRTSLDALRRLRGVRGLPFAFCSTVSAFGNEVATGPSPLPVQRGESPRLFEGCYTTRPDAKQRNRDAENALLSAETLAAVAGVDMQDELDDAWRRTMFHQFHDILAGTVVAEAYDKHVEDAAAAMATAARVTDRALAALGGPATPGAVAVVTNPLGFERRDVVDVEVELEGGDGDEAAVLLVSDSGHEAWAQRTAGGLCFVASVGPLATVAYRRSPRSGAVAPGTMAGEPAVPMVEPYPSSRIDASRYLRVETDALVATVRRDSGVITSLVDRRAGHELVGFGMRRGSDYFDTARSDLALGVYQLVDEDGARHVGMSGWHLDEVRSERSLISGASCEVVEDGPVRCVVQVVHQVDESTITTHIAFHRELPRIDYRADIAWRERAGAERIPNLKVSFCAELDEAQAWFETPHSAARRPAGGLEVPALRWAAVGGGGSGLALLNDGRSGHDALGTRLRLTLARSAASPDLTSGPGDYATRFALLPLRDGIDTAAISREAAGFNQPLITRPPAAGGSAAAQALRPVLVGDDSVLLAAMKHARDGRARVLRLVEARGAAATVRLAGVPPHATVWDCDLTEQRVAPCARVDGDVVLRFGPRQVRTVLVDEADA